MASAGILQGIESIVESWVSTLEIHSSKKRNLTQDRLHQEAMVAINGFDTLHCDNVVKEGLGMFFSRAKREGDRLGHFIRRSQNVKSYHVSRAVDSLI